MRIFGIAVLQPYRHLGVTALLFMEEIIRGVARGYRFAEASWVLEDNHLSNSSIQGRPGARSGTRPTGSTRSPSFECGLSSGIADRSPDGMTFRPAKDKFLA